MKFVRLEVENFGCVDSAQLDLGPGINVLYGPNDLGKSTLARALRSVLLLPATSGSSDRQAFEPWGSAGIPRVRLTFEREGVIYRVDKQFAGSRGTALLERVHEGEAFVKTHQAREVDAELRRMTGWGIREPGGRLTPRGLPSSFITTALLGQQATAGEVFLADLSSDSDEAGRQSLTATLGTLAQDPRLVGMLELADKKVAEAKTGTGQWRRGKVSPLLRVMDKIESLGRQHAELVRARDEVERIHAAIGQKTSERDSWHAQRADAAQKVAIMEQQHESTIQWRRYQENLARAQARLDDTARDAAQLLSLRSELSVTRERLDLVQQQQHDVEHAVQGAQRELHDARTLLAQEQAGGDEVARLSVQRLMAQKREIEAEIAGMEAEKRDIERALALREAADAAVRVFDEVRATSEGLERRCQAIEARVENVKSEQREAQALVGWVRWQQLQQQLAQGAQDAARAQNMVTEAARLRAEAANVEKELIGRGLPDRAFVEHASKLEQFRRTAEARAASGIGVEIALRDGLVNAIHADGKSVAAAGALKVRADREIVLDLGELGTVTIVAGSRDDIDTLADARARWTSQITPVLLRCNVADVEALRQAVQEAESASSKAREAMDNAESLEERATLLLRGREERVHIEDECRQCEQQFCSFEQHLTSLASNIDLAHARAQLAQVVATLEQLLSELAIAKRANATATIELARAQAQAEEAARAATNSAQDFPEGINGALQANHDGRERLEQAMQQVDGALEDAHRQHQERLECARDKVSLLEQKYESLQTRIEGVRKEGMILREQLASVSGRIGDLEARLAGTNIDALRTELAAIVASAPLEPTFDVGPDALADARERLQDIDRELNRSQAELIKAEGHLESLGGSMAAVKANETERALAAARHQEQEIRRDYQAWELLRDTLKNALANERRHVGDALAGAIAPRLRELTAQRYGRLEVTRELRTTGLQAAGSARDMDQLSAGLQEQIALLLRVAVAEHLHSALVLDDHLTHTDPARLGYFRDLMAEVGNHIQVVILTCRPEDYVNIQLLPQVCEEPWKDVTAQCRVWDLQRVLVRGSNS